MKRVMLGLVVVIGWNQPTTAKADPPTSKELFEALNQLVPAKTFLQPMTLKEALGLFLEKCAARNLPFVYFVDTVAFRAEDPKCENPLDAAIDLTAIPPQIKLRLEDLLQRVLNQIPHRASYLVRDGFIEITTKERVSVKSLLKRTVTGLLQNVALDEALAQLSGKTGASIILDPSVKKQSKKPITATFRNDVTLEGALCIITEMADLEFVVMQSGIYVTTEKRANALRKRIRKRELENPGL